MSALKASANLLLVGPNGSNTSTTTLSDWTALSGRAKILRREVRIYVVGYRKSKKELSGTEGRFSVTDLNLLTRKSVYVKIY